MIHKKAHFGVIGGGAWGTALAVALDRAGLAVTLWARNAKVVDEINAHHKNTTYLPGVELSPEIKATTGMAELSACEAWLVVTPLQHLRDVCSKVKEANNAFSGPIIICSKGVEQKTLALPTEILAEIFPSNPLAVLSGPSFAAEVAMNQPTALTLACRNVNLGLRLSQAICSPTLRPYISDDIVGVQIGGAVKNVLAIACGIAKGRGMGENARAALITRGLAEIVRLGVALGGHPETLMGLSGLGDLVLTCSSLQSRNMSLGVALGEGQSLADILASRATVAEGVFSAASTKALADKHKIDMPIVTAVDAILNKGADVGATITALLSRPLKAEAL